MIKIVLQGSKKPLIIDGTTDLSKFNLGSLIQGATKGTEVT
jgi:hypothetical protein